LGVGYVDVAAGGEGDDRFEFGVEVLVRGLAAMPG